MLVDLQFEQCTIKIIHSSLIQTTCTNAICSIFFTRQIATKIVRVTCMVSCNMQLFFCTKSCARNGSVWHGLKIKVHVLYAFILVLILVYNYISFLSKLFIIKDCLYCTVPALAPMPAPATKHPSINLCGSFRMISLSLHVPGSPSSALTTRYLGLHKPITV